ncbi:transcriptional regulator with XRE-family HTH domain [Evansella vedderi]|uniref:Transcriptional regulator with XRE-family HTH domain n=1 Tax=Evansella vedderi TaxID=38282 RepID=A0ABU0A3W2_9BACI|nr:helix-turn-helix transcriptional regulator [Evansella vedderi]MDQ0257945.1 transcriptional regulator with XRE-family HTH domain [Evansella vedderi]
MEQHIGEYIRFIRKQKKITLVDLAKKTGFSQPYLSQIETNKNKDKPPAPDLLEKIAKALNTDYSTLLKKAGYSFIDEIWDNNTQKGTLVFDVNFMETKKDKNGAKSSKYLTKEEVLQRFFDFNTLLEERQEINYKGISFTEKDKQLLKIFLDTLMHDKKDTQ